MPEFDKKSQAKLIYNNFFCSEKDLEEWRKKNPEIKYGEIYSIDDALEHGKTIFGDFLK